jgi:CubicO group peptidase (beta-lactamase class C family)
VQVEGSLRKVPQPSFAPGATYGYSNSGYVLLALIIEVVAGVPLARFLETNIFAPLGMNDTFVLTDPQQKLGDVARGYDRAGQPDDYQGMATGESVVYSTVGDPAAIWPGTVHRRPRHSAGSGGGLTPATIAKGKTTYGLGWNITSDKAGLRAWHQGNTAGFRALLERRLRDRITTIMLTNGGDTDRLGLITNTGRCTRPEAASECPSVVSRAQPQAAARVARLRERNDAPRPICPRAAMGYRTRLTSARTSQRAPRCIRPNLAEHRIEYPVVSGNGATDRRLPC